jgi:hypothetical protein
LNPDARQSYRSTKKYLGPNKQFAEDHNREPKCVANQGCGCGSKFAEII